LAQFAHNSAKNETTGGIALPFHIMLKPKHINITKGPIFRHSRLYSRLQELKDLYKQIIRNITLATKE